MSGEHSIHIQHFDARYSIPKGLGDAAGIQRRFDAIATELLPKVWDERISRMARDEAIYFIERVEVAVAIDVKDAVDRSVADAWATTLQQGIVRTINRNEGGVIVFRNRAEFLASFAQDLLRGVAWDRWYYEEFREAIGRQAGPFIVDLLMEDADVGREAMMELVSRGDLDLLLASLGDADADRLIARCLLPPGPTIAFSHMYRAWVGGLRPLLAGFIPTTPARDLARLYLRLIAAHPELGPDVNLARFIGDLLALRRRFADGGERMIRLLESDRLAEMFDGFDRSAEGNLLRGLVRELPGSEVAALLRDLGAGEELPSRMLTTRFGGLYLFVPAMIDLGIGDIVAELEREERGNGTALLELATLAMIGIETARGMKRDGGASFFAGLERFNSEEDRNRYCKRLLLQLKNLQKLTSLIYHNERSSGPQSDVAEDEAARILEERALAALSLRPDDEHLPEGAPLVEDAGLDDLIGRLSWRIMESFSGRLGAFAGSSPAYIRRNFIECYAEIEINDERIVIRFLTCPLQMVLRMAGFENMTPKPSWLGGRTLEYSFER